MIRVDYILDGQTHKQYYNPDYYDIHEAKADVLRDYPDAEIIAAYLTQDIALPRMWWR